MKVIDPGHLYELQVIDRYQGVYEPLWLRFVKRAGPGYPGNTGIYPGTIIQDVLRACIDRLKYVDNQIHHDTNWLCIQLLRMAIFLLEMRAAERHGVKLPKIRQDIENLPVGGNGHLVCGAGEDHA